MVMEGLRHTDGVTIRGRNVKNIRYAYEMVFIADSEEKLYDLADILQEERTMIRLKINIEEPEVNGVPKILVKITVESTLLK